MPAAGHHEFPGSAARRKGHRFCARGCAEAVLPIVEYDRSEALSEVQPDPAFVRSYPPPGVSDSSSHPGCGHVDPGRCGCYAIDPNPVWQKCECSFCQAVDGQYPGLVCPTRQ